MHGIRSSKLKRKFQAALPDSQISDSKVWATSAMYPISNGQKFDWSCTNRRQVDNVLWILVPWWGREGIEQEFWEQEHPPLHSEVACAIHQTASWKATGSHEVPAELFKAGETVLSECSEYVWQSGKLVSGQRNGRCPHSSHFPRKVILNCVQITEQLLLPPMQARSVFGSYWKEWEWRPKRKLQTNRRDSSKEGGQEIKSWMSEYWCTRHASTYNHSICALRTSRRHSTLSPMISSGWLWWTWWSK